MSSIVSTERGAMILESLISATLLAVTFVTVITFMHRALKGAQIQRHLLEPACEHAVCVGSSTSTTCRCGAHTSLVLQ